MFFKRKSPSELPTETVSKIYNKLTELQADISKLQAETDRIDQNVKSLRGKVNRERRNDPEEENEKAFIGANTYRP